MGTCRYVPSKKKKRPELQLKKVDGPVVDLVSWRELQLGEHVFNKQKDLKLKILWHIDS